LPGAPSAPNGPSRYYAVAAPEQFTTPARVPVILPARASVVTHSRASAVSVAHDDDRESAEGVERDD
jgi:hypothetical protein